MSVCVHYQSSAERVMDELFDPASVSMYEPNAETPVVEQSNETVLNELAANDAGVAALPNPTMNVPLVEIVGVPRIVTGICIITRILVVVVPCPTA